MIWLLTILLGVIPSTLSCGEKAVLTNGEEYVIESPNYPNPFPAKTKCDWNITTESTGRFRLECPSIDLKPTQTCKWNKITVPIGTLKFSFCDRRELVLLIYGQSFRFEFFSRHMFPNKKYIGFSCTVSFMGDSSDQSGTEAPEPTVPEPSESPSEQACTCGIKNPFRIIGGSEVALHEFPWQALLRNNLARPFCGGVVISQNFVLTASHCLMKFTIANMFVSLGDHDKLKYTETNKTIHTRVSEIIRHENYNTETAENDIALLRLAKIISFNNAISPVCLPYGIEDDSLSGEIGTITGWGKVKDGGKSSKILQMLELPILTTNECRRYYPDGITDNMICTYRKGRDSCDGDSGGPLVWSRNERNFLVGIISWGKGCARYRKPGVNAKVTNYLKWIEEKTGETFCRV